MPITIEQIEQLAINDAQLPNELQQPELLLFLQLRQLYRSYRLGTITKERGTAEKTEIMRKYKEISEKVGQDELLKFARDNLGTVVKYNDIEYVITAVIARNTGYSVELKDLKANNSVVIADIGKVVI